VVDEANAVEPDAVLLLGDYRAGHHMMRFARQVADAEWTAVLAGLRAPLGVHAVLGNHDWWDDPAAQANRHGPTEVGLALQAIGIPVYENAAVRLNKNGRPFWIAGLGDQWAFWLPFHLERPPPARQRHYGVHDLSGTLARVTDDAPVILLAHEP